jgi:hypothetical protein
MFKIEDPNMEKPPKKRGCVGIGWWVEIPAVALALYVFYFFFMVPP